MLLILMVSQKVHLSRSERDCAATSSLRRTYRWTSYETINIPRSKL